MLHEDDGHDVVNLNYGNTGIGSLTISSDQLGTLEASKTGTQAQNSPTATVRLSQGPVPIFSKINP